MYRDVMSRVLVVNRHDSSAT